MRVLVTGAAGFLGQRVIQSLLSGPPGLPPLSRIVAVDLVAGPSEDSRVEAQAGTITDPAFIGSIAGSGIDVVYHLAAVLSGQSETDFDLGMRVNVDATRALLDACRRLRTAPRFVFASSVAVFGGTLPAVVPEEMALLPQSSYGTEKAIGELLVADYSRRGFVDGIVCRLPTVTVRPGKPNSAASSFVSGIIREPLAGIESVCPVPLETRLWIASPARVTGNLVHAARVPAAALEGRRTVNFPGLCVTAREMLASLERVGGRAARALVRCEPDERIVRIVGTWPGAFDVSRPLRLGFAVDRDMDSIVQQYLREVQET
jgi:nucleoside-diphosphate-sugar epimerase